jgi:hypothetical protein
MSLYGLADAAGVGKITREELIVAIGKDLKVQLG